MINTPMETNLKLVRGARVIQVLDEDSTYPDLYTNIQRGFPNTTKRQHATGPVVVQNTQYTPYAANGGLQINSEVRSGGNLYTPVIQLLNVDFQQNDEPTNVTFKATNDQDYHVVPVRLTDHNVKVRCNCLDFYHRFAVWNHADNSLFGPKPPPYQRKTTDRPEVNPQRVPGFCKHLIKLFQELEHEGLTTR